jgi:hypothetical protein
VSDPLALYHMTVKDQHIFEEPDIFITSVILLISHAVTQYYQSPNKLLFGEGLISTIGLSDLVINDLLVFLNSDTN